MKNAKELLRQVGERFPSPRPDQRHSLTLDGDVLVLTLMEGHTYQRFNIESHDLDKTVAQLVDELEGLVKTSLVDPGPPIKPVA